MYFRITADSVELVEPNDVKSFAVTCPADLDRQRFAEQLRAADLGELCADGEHVMVPVQTVRRMASPQVGDGWEADFEKMIGYAESKGWMSEDHTLVRAHIERN